MRNKRSVGDLKECELNGRKVLVRVDFDIPLDDSLNITDDTKIRAAVPTVKFLMVHGARVIICSHLGRPEGVSSEYGLQPLVPRLSQLLGVEVKMANDCVGKEVEEMVAQLSNGGVLLLENVRAHASTEGLTKFLRPSVVGFQMHKELNHLVQAETIPKKPFAAIVGGNDLSTKYGVIEFLVSC
ncbi:hypothetical protein SLA2020_153300 [Shorea laevis]